MGNICKRCGKVIREKNKTAYSFICKPCLKVIQKRLMLGGKKKKHYSPQEILDELRFAYETVCCFVLFSYNFTTSFAYISHIFLVSFATYHFATFLMYVLDSFNIGK
jgi:hypothetical protein